MANRLSRRLRIAVFATAIATAAVLVPTVAGAAPKPKDPAKPTVSSVQKELSKLAVKNTQLVESYDEAQIAVKSAQKSALAAEKAARLANAAVNTAHVALSQTALAEYEGGSFSSAGALLSSNSDSSYIDQLDTMQMISTHSEQVISMFTTAKQAAVAAQRRAGKLLAAATKTRNTLAADKKTVESQISKYSKLLNTLSAAQVREFQSVMSPAVTSAAKTSAISQIPDITAAQVRIAVTFAVNQVGKPYSWGSAGPGSYDCSGLTMAAYRAAGINLPHSAADQYNYGTHVSFADLQPGDLMFFYRPRIGHVTMYIGNGLMVSAPETGEDVTIIPATSFGDAFVGATRLINS